MKLNLTGNNKTIVAVVVVIAAVVLVIVGAVSGGDAFDFIKDIAND